MTAVIRPIGIDHADLSNGWSTFFGFFKVFLAEGNIAKVHCQTIVFDEVTKSLLIQVAESIQNCNISRNIVWCMQSFRSFQRSLHRFNRVDQVCFDAGKFFIADALNYIYLCGSNGWTIMLCSQLDALCSGIRTLVKLSWQELNGKYLFILRKSRQRIIYIIYLWFRKDCFLCKFKVLVRNIFDIITIQDTDTFGCMDTQRAADIRKNSLCLNSERCLFFNIHSVNRHQISESSFLLVIK